MKRIIALILIFIYICSCAIGEEPATPTDLEDYIEIEDDDFGYIEPELLERKVFLTWLTEPSYYYEEVTLIAILMDFLPTDTYTFSWEYSEDCKNWIEIEGEHEQMYTFILDEINVHYYWRVKVTWYTGDYFN